MKKGTERLLNDVQDHTLTDVRIAAVPAHLVSPWAPRNIGHITRK